VPAVSVSIVDALKRLLPEEMFVGRDDVDGTILSRSGAGAGFQQWVFKFDNLLPKKKSKIIEFSDYLLFGRLFILLRTYMLLFSKRRILELIRREVFFTKSSLS
jgi:hypothetical protein